MSIGLPDIDIVFKQKAITAITRSERGVACIVVRDTTASVHCYKYETDINSSTYSDENFKMIKRAFLVAVNKVYVIAVTTSAEFSAITAELDKIKYNYVCCTSAGDQQQLVNYIIAKNQNSKGKKYVALVADATTADSKYVINVKNASVHDKDTDLTVSMVNYLPRLCSILANLPMNRSITFYELEDIDNVDMSFITSEENEDYWTNKGFLLLIPDENKIKVGRGVNSLITFTTTDTEDMRKIIIVESMNIIIEDIYNTFKDYYVGKYKNSYDNQCLFISAVNGYFRGLAREEILEATYDNKAEVDVDVQREAWISIGKTEAEDWDANKVKNMTFKSFVYLQGQVKILDAIEDLKFTINME